MASFKIGKEIHRVAEGATGAPRIEFEAMASWYTTAGAVGTYAFCGTINELDYEPGDTIAGGSLRYAAVHRLGNQTGGTGRWDNTGAFPLYSAQEVIPAAPAGTWRCMGNARYSPSASNGRWPATLWLRIS
jgi:hypothetical protein